MKKSASAIWEGGLKDGKGKISTESGVLNNTAYGFKNRFENEKGTNPEELVGAAHAGCFSMAFSAELGKLGVTPQKIETKAVVTLDQVDGGFVVTHIDLDVHIAAPDGEQAKIEQAVKAAKEGCPISKLLNTKISMNLSIAAAKAA